MALERPEPRTPGRRGFGIDLDAEDDSVKGCQQRLAPAVPILVAGRTTTQSAASASGTWSSAPSGCSEHWNRAETGGWIVIASIGPDWAA